MIFNKKPFLLGILVLSIATINTSVLLCSDVRIARNYIDQVNNLDIQHTILTNKIDWTKLIGSSIVLGASAIGTYRAYDYILRSIINYQKDLKIQKCLIKKFSENNEIKSHQDSNYKIVRDAFHMSAYARREFPTAESIVASFSPDKGQLQSFDLSKQGQPFEMLEHKATTTNKETSKSPYSGYYYFGEPFMLKLIKDIKEGYNSANKVYVFQNESVINPNDTFLNTIVFKYLVSNIKSEMEEIWNVMKTLENQWSEMKWKRYKKWWSFSGEYEDTREAEAKFREVASRIFEKNGSPSGYEVKEESSSWILSGSDYKKIIEGLNSLKVKVNVSKDDNIISKFRLTFTYDERINARIDAYIELFKLYTRLAAMKQVIEWCNACPNKYGIEALKSRPNENSNIRINADANIRRFFERGI